MRFDYLEVCETISLIKLFTYSNVRNPIFQAAERHRFQNLQVVHETSVYTLHVILVLLLF